MIRTLLILLLVTPAWSMAQEADKEERGPSLAELARQERERRANLKEVPIITNAELKTIKGLVSTGEAPVSASKEETSEEGEEEGTSQESKEEALSELQAQINEARLNVTTAVNQGNVLQLRVNDLRNSYFSETDGARQAQLQQQIQEALQSIENNRAEVEQARQALQQLEQQAAQAGVPPGTVREWVGETPESTSIR